MFHKTTTPPIEPAFHTQGRATEPRITTTVYSTNTLNGMNYSDMHFFSRFGL